MRTLKVLKRLRLPLFILSFHAAAAHYCVSATTNVDPNPCWRDHRLACGPICATFLLALFEKPVEYQQVVACCPPDSNGTTLDDLRRALESMGLSTLGLRLRHVEDIQLLKHPAIAHYSAPAGQNHFAVVFPALPGSTAMLIFDPIRGLVHAEASDVVRNFTGNCLVTRSEQFAGVSDALREPAQWNAFPVIVAMLDVAVIASVVGLWLVRSYQKPSSRAIASWALWCVVLSITFPVASCERVETDVHERQSRASPDAPSPRLAQQHDFGDVLQGVRWTPLSRPKNVIS